MVNRNFLFSWKYNEINCAVTSVTTVYQFEANLICVVITFSAISELTNS